jgi:hypothetical protein
LNLVTLLPLLEVVCCVTAVVTNGSGLHGGGRPAYTARSQRSFADLSKMVERVAAEKVGE